MLFALKQGIDLLERLPLRLNPPVNLFLLVIDHNRAQRGPKLTIMPRIMISQLPFTKYIFQVMFARPIGIMKTNTSAKAFKAKLVPATPLARIEKLSTSGG
jgi:hypothetical protein